ncbi:MAG: cell division protein ZapA [Saprospiraceae bacterium]|nr:cell division protein ZapA [Saprospiraceae bacterium]
MDKDLIHIQLQIAGRSYPISVESREEESLVREVVDSINSKISFFLNTHKSIDKQDALAMSVLTYAVDLFKQDKQAATLSEEEISKSLQNINLTLDDILKS